MCKKLLGLLFVYGFLACGDSGGPAGPQRQTETIPNSALGSTGTDEATGSVQTGGASEETSTTQGGNTSSGVYNTATGGLNWADVIQSANLYDNIYAIYYCCYIENGIRYVNFIGTGFAAGFSNVLWTNAHVVHALFDRPGVKAFDFEYALARRSGSAWADRSSPSQLVLDDIRFIVHPNYDGTTHSEDVAAFVFLDEPFRYERLPALLPKDFVGDLREGQPIGTLGFPGELTRVTGPDEIVSPTFKPGTLSRFLSLGTGTQNRRMLQYNLTTTGGTSGSPVFDHLGYIIGMNHASHAGSEVFDSDGDVVNVNTANAAYAIRVDALHELIPPLPFFNSPARARRTADSQPYPYLVYHPFPE